MTTSAVAGGRAACWIWLRRGGLLVLLLVVVYTFLPKMAGAREAISQLSQVRPAYLVTGLLLELASLCCYSGLTHTLLAPGNRPRYETVLRVDLTGLGFSHVVPGGAATATALRYRLLTQVGVPGSDVVPVSALEAVITNLSAAGVLGLGLLVALPSGWDDLPLATAAAVTASVLGGLVLGLVELARHRDRVVRAARWVAVRVPRFDPDSVQRTLDSLAEHLRALSADRRLMRRTLLWVMGHVFLDAASLCVFLWAFGPVGGFEGLLLGYGLAGLLVRLPITPGGIGLVEGSLIPVLVAFGTADATAVLGVISWRLAEFWLPIPLSGLTYISLWDGRSGRRPIRAVKGPVSRGPMPREQS